MKPARRATAFALLACIAAQAVAAMDAGAATPTPAAAGQPAAGTETFLPPGALAYRETRLGNGLRIIAQTARSAPYVSLRLVIRTGSDGFPCQDRELAHLVEHLLFSANSRLDEDEIDNAVTSWGGSINAYTYDEQTDVVLDVHARHQEDAIRLLAGMIRDFAPQDEDVAREADVVERESGVAHTPLRLWWSSLPATQSAMTRYSLAAGLVCDAGIAPVHHLDGTAVREAFATAYVASNMTLVLVGDLSGTAVATASAQFSALPARPPPARRLPALSVPAPGTFSSGWLSGVSNLDEPVAVGMTAFRDWQGYYVLALAESWLNDRMFRDLRSQRGIAYTPAAGLSYHYRLLSLTLATETEPADTAFALAYLQQLTEEVRSNGISEADFEHLRRASLLGMAQSFETIASRADYLASSMREIDSGGLFQMERFYRDLDYATFRALLARDWPAHFVVMDNSPPVSWSMRAGLLGGSVALLLTALGLLAWRRRRAQTAASPLV